MSGDNNRRAIVALDIVDLLLFTQYFKASFQLDTKKKKTCHRSQNVHTF